MIMANYFEMSKDQLRAEKAALEQSYAEFKAKGWRFVQCCATRIGEGLFELLYTFCSTWLAVNQALIRWTWPWIC